MLERATDRPIFVLQNLTKELEKLNVKVSHGEYGADMDVELINDGPVTILLDSSKEF